MASAWGKLTGKPGICLVTRGPGVTNAAIGIHTAMQDSAPMILFVGQIARSDRDREAFQEVDYRQMFGGLAKWAAEIDDTGRIPEYVARAWDLAMSGRPGPVVLALPEDMLSAQSDAPDLDPGPAPVAGVSAAQVDAVTAALAAAERPLVVPGGSVWTQDDAGNLARFAERWGLPVAVPFRRQHLFDNRLPNYVGDLGVGMNPKLGEALQARLARRDMVPGLLDVGYDPSDSAARDLALRQYAFMLPMDERGLGHGEWIRKLGLAAVMERALDDDISRRASPGTLVGSPLNRLARSGAAR